MSEQTRTTQTIEEVRARRRPVEETLAKLREDMAAYQKVCYLSNYLSISTSLPLYLSTSLLFISMC